ncbi:MAG: HAMP domain-containing sensor histidine kinase [Thermodesulfobacteriota bacterium]
MNRVYTGKNEKAEETARSTAGLVHDLNNLLMILQGNIELLNIINGEYGALKEVLSIMESVVNQVREIAKSLMDVCILNFERSLSLKNEANEIDINQVVRIVVDMVKSRLHNGVLITSKLEAGLWPVHGDVLEIQRLLVNLADNAYNAIPATGIIRVSTTNINRESNYFVCLSVHDTGIGMEDSVLNQIFKPLYTTRENGHGMGMSVVKQVTEEHGGFIEVESIPGTGTEVRVYFPALKDQAAMGGS